MRNAIRLAVAAALLAAAATPAASTLVNPDVIKGTTLFEGYPAATHVGSRRLFAWSNEANANRIAAFAEVNGGTVTRINPRRTSAYVGGYDQGTDLLIYQQVRGNQSDLFLYDAGERRRMPLRALNDKKWQWNPSIDTHKGTRWILYGVNRFSSPGAPWRLYLYNDKTGEKLLLDETTNRCGCLFPGTVAYPWVTWAIGEDASAWRYNIKTQERVQLLPSTRDEYAVAVTPDGVSYVAQGGDRCGSNAKVFRVNEDGTSVELLSFKKRREATNLTVDTTGPFDRLYYERRNCRTGTSDILRLRRANVIGSSASAPARTDVVGRASASTRSASSPDASPRSG